jgi:glutamyl-tRNA reductase
MFHDLDSISKELEENKEMRIASKSDVINIIVEELTTYNEWLNEAPLRALLANLKISINKVVTKQFQPNIEDTQIKLVTNEVMKKLINQKETLALLPENELNKIISDEASLLINNL